MHKFIFKNKKEETKKQIKEFFVDLNRIERVLIQENQMKQRKLTTIPFIELPYELSNNSTISHKQRIMNARCTLFYEVEGLRKQNVLFSKKMDILYQIKTMVREDSKEMLKSNQVHLCYIFKTDELSEFIFKFPESINENLRIADKIKASLQLKQCLSSNDLINLFIQTIINEIPNYSKADMYIPYSQKHEVIAEILFTPGNFISNIIRNTLKKAKINSVDDIISLVESLTNEILRVLKDFDISNKHSQSLINANETATILIERTLYEDIASKHQDVVYGRVKSPKTNDAISRIVLPSYIRQSNDKRNMKNELFSLDEIMKTDEMKAAVSLINEMEFHLYPFDILRCFMAAIDQIVRLIRRIGSKEDSLTCDDILTLIILCLNHAFYENGTIPDLYGISNYVLSFASHKKMAFSCEYSLMTLEAVTRIIF